MATPEGKIKAALKKRLNELGVYAFWPVQTGYGAATLDCIGCWQGRFFAIECKAPGKQMTLRQQLVASIIHEAGGLV